MGCCLALLTGSNPSNSNFVELPKISLTPPTVLDPKYKGKYIQLNSNNNIAKGKGLVVGLESLNTDKVYFEVKFRCDPDSKGGSGSSKDGSGSSSKDGSSSSSSKDGSSSSKGDSSSKKKMKEVDKEEDEETSASVVAAAPATAPPTPPRHGRAGARRAQRRKTQLPCSLKTRKLPGRTGSFLKTKTYS